MSKCTQCVSLCACMCMYLYTLSGKDHSSEDTKGRKIRQNKRTHRAKYKGQTYSTTGDVETIVGGYLLTNVSIAQ